MKTLQKDMTTGNPGKIILNFTFPIFLGIYFNSFTIWWIRSLSVSL